MPPENRVYFLADMHLKPLDASRARVREMAVRDNERLAAFLESIQGKASSLVLLGDAFNFWFERRGKMVGDYLTALSLFKLASDNGLDIHHVSGNRDFVVGEGLAPDTTAHYSGFFRQRSGWTVSLLCDYGIEPHGPRYRFHQAGKTISCVHGDALCTGDRMFMLMRWLMMGFPGRTVMRFCPWGMGRHVIEALQSRTGIRRPKADPADLLDAEMIRREVAMGADLLVCGHIHAFHERTVEVAGRKGRMVALPAWLDGFYGVLEGGVLRIEEFRA